jgi:hypothetical protein
MKKINSRSEYVSSPVLIDSGPLLLLFTGIYNKDLIGRSRRIKDYQPIHFDILIQYLAGRRIIVTPGVLAELTNLAKYIKDINFTKFIESNNEGLKKLGEHHISKELILETDEFSRLGYTDTSILLSAKKNNGEVLTEDHELFLRCRKVGMKATHMVEIKDKADGFR